MTNVTVIVPTFNRPAYLKRILTYYNGYNVEFKIIIADSSSTENKVRNKEIVSGFGNLDIQYLGEYLPVANAYPKFSDALNHVTTTYCAFCADDDFITPAGVRESIAFLENNPDFATAHGYNYTFTITKDKDNKGQLHWVSPYAAESISQMDAGVRLEYHLSHYSQVTIYAIHRTELIKEAYQQALESQTDLIIFGELLFSMLTIIQGKLKFLDVFYAARDGTSTATGRYLPTLKTALEAGTFDAEYAKFRGCLALHLNKQSRLSVEEAGKLVDNAMSAYMKKYFFSKKRFGSLTTGAGRTLDRLHLPRWLDKGIRNTYRKLTGAEYIEKDFTDLSPSSPYYEDIERIRRHVLSYSLTNTV
jgi:glycosyltransferase domain-containing protein